MKRYIGLDTRRRSCISVEKGCVAIDWPSLQTGLLERKEKYRPHEIRFTLSPFVSCSLCLVPCALCLVPGALCLAGQIRRPGKLNLCSIIRSIPSTLCFIHGVAHHPSIDQGPVDRTRLGALAGRRRSCDGPTNLGGGKVIDRVEAYQMT